MWYLIFLLYINHIALFIIFYVIVYNRNEYFIYCKITITTIKKILESAFHFPVVPYYATMNTDKTVLQKLKVEKATQRNKKLKPSQSDKIVVCKLTEKKKKPKYVNEIEKVSQTKLSVSAIEIEQMKKTEVEMMERIRHLKRRLRHFERRFDDVLKGEILSHLNKTIDNIAVQTDNKTTHSEQIADLKCMIEVLNTKLLELTEISKYNQLVNVQSQSGSENSHAELSRSIEHLERRIDRLIEFLEMQNKNASYMKFSNFSFSEFGNGDQLENKVRPVHELFLQNRAEMANNTKRLQSIVIVNEPIYPQVCIFIKRKCGDLSCFRNIRKLNRQNCHQNVL